jgi:hypothetical protein
MMMRMIGKHALRRPSTIDHAVMPTMEVSAYFSGTIPKAGVAKTDKRIVTTNVIKALFQPDILSPIIKMNRNAIGIAEMSAAIETDF